MTFKTGQSGNPQGRAKGSLNRRTQLAKLLEPHAETLVAKMIELALGGDVNALRLCIERLIPKMQNEPMGISLPQELTSSKITILKNDILRAVFERRMSADEAEKLISLIDARNDTQKDDIELLLHKLPDDPIEASKIYQKIMRQN